MNNSKMRRNTRLEGKRRRRPSTKWRKQVKKYESGESGPLEGNRWAGSLDSSQESIQNAQKSPSFDMPGNDDVCTRDNIQVLLRVRPKNDRERELECRTVLKALNSATIMFDPKQEAVEFFFHGVRQKVYDYKQRPNKNLRFAFDHVFSPLQSNVEIFDNALKPIVNHVIRGFNCSVFAYGATGSGKTYTMLGSAENPGLTFLMAKELSQKIGEMAHEFESEIVVSYLEVYNETIKDLLYPSGTLSIREDGLSGVHIPNLTVHKIQDTCDLLRMLSFGNSARTQHPTDHNAESSRSHAVFQVFVTLRRRITHFSVNYRTVKAKLVMVDLAGSERGSTTNSDCQRCREGGSINKSLLALGNCINALADGKKHIPYRDSKLTRLLKDSLGGNCKTVMIANVAPTVLNYDESYNTLRYADRAKQIRVTVKKNVSIEPAYLQHPAKILELQNEVLQLKLLLQAERSAKFCISDPVHGLSGACSNASFLSFSPAIQNPAALENFIHLLGQKRKLEEAHVDASVLAKEAEWALMWQKWRLDSLRTLFWHQDTTHPEYKKLRNVCKTLMLEHEECLEKVHLAKRLLDFNDKEIDLIERNFLDTLKQDDPFLTITLREFLNYKHLEREVGTCKSLQNFNHTISNRMLQELLQTELCLCHALQFSQYLQKVVEKHQIPFEKSRHQKMLEQLAGESCDVNASVIHDAEAIQAMIQIIRNPVVEYERKETAAFANQNTLVSSPEFFQRSQTRLDSRFDHPTSLFSGSDSESSRHEFGVGESINNQPSCEAGESSEVGPVASHQNYKLPGTELSPPGIPGVVSAGTPEEAQPRVSPAASQFQRSEGPEPHSNISSSSQPPENPLQLSPKRKLSQRKKTRRKPISLSGRKGKSDYATKTDYSGSSETRTEKQQPLRPPERETELLKIFKGAQKQGDGSPPPLAGPHSPETEKLQLSPKSFRDQGRGESSPCSVEETKRLSPQVTLPQTFSSKTPSPQNQTFGNTLIENNSVLSTSASTQAASQPPPKKTVRKARKKSQKTSKVTLFKNAVKAGIKPKKCRTAKKSPRNRTPKEHSYAQKSVKKPESRCFHTDPPAISKNEKKKVRNPKIQLQKEVQMTHETRKFDFTDGNFGETKPSKNEGIFENDLTSTQMFSKTSRIPKCPSPFTRCPFKNPLTPTKHRSSPTRRIQEKPLSTFQKLLSSTNLMEKGDEEKVKEKAKNRTMKSRNFNTRVDDGSKQRFEESNSGEAQFSRTCKQDSREDFWTNGMFPPSSAPESSRFSGDQFELETDFPNPRKFNFPEEQAIDLEQIDLDHYKSHYISPANPPAPLSPELLPANFLRLSSKSKSRNQNVVKLSIKNLEARERGWNDNFWKTDSELGDGDMRCDSDIGDTRENVAYGNHEHLIVQPPPGYEHAPPAYSPRIISRPQK